MLVLGVARLAVDDVGEGVPRDGHGECVVWERGGDVWCGGGSGWREEGKGYVCRSEERGCLNRWPPV